MTILHAVGCSVFPPKVFRIIGILSLLFSLVSCASGDFSTDRSSPNLPPEWSRDFTSGEVSVEWLSPFGDEILSRLVNCALESNYMLKTEEAYLEEAFQELLIAKSTALPVAALFLSRSRGRVQDSGQGHSTISSPIDLNLSVNWEMDLWGQLSDIQQAAQLYYAAQQARYESAKRRVISDTTSTYFSAIEAVELLNLAQRRLGNANESFEIVNQGYLLGINDALDLYLAQSVVETNESQLAERQQLLLERIAQLQLNLGLYPDGNMELGSNLPVISAPTSTGIPSELLTNRPDLQLVWLQLLTADVESAIAHKNRFPVLILTANIGLASRNPPDLSNSESLLWSLAGGVIQPIFEGGRLRALEKQADARITQAENIYLDTVNGAIAEVENALSDRRSLGQSFESALNAESSADAALTLALEQYQRGLIQYITVLGSQQRAFDAATTVIQLRNLLLQNRIQLQLALGVPL